MTPREQIKELHDRMGAAFIGQREVIERLLISHADIAPRSNLPDVQLPE